jgi:hypothetical protein
MIVEVVACFRVKTLRQLRSSMESALSCQKCLFAASLNSRRKRFSATAARLHKYDLHVKLHRSATLPRPVRPSTKPVGIVFVDDGEISGSTTEAASGTLMTFGILILTCWSIQASRGPVEGGPSLHSVVPDKFPSAIHTPSMNSDQSPTVKGRQTETSSSRGKANTIVRTFPYRPAIAALCSNPVV